MITQNKWKYLESIFASDDIKMQLPEEAKKFGRTDASYKKIMETSLKEIHFHIWETENLIFLEISETICTIFDILKCLNFEN